MPCWCGATAATIADDDNNVTAADTPAARSSDASRDRATGKNGSDAIRIEDDAVSSDAVSSEAVSSVDVEGSDEDVVAAAEEKMHALADAKARVEEEASKELEKAVVEGVDENLAKSLADMLPNITRG